MAVVTEDKLEKRLKSLVPWTENVHPLPFSRHERINPYILRPAFQASRLNFKLNAMTSVCKVLALQTEFSHQMKYEYF